MEATGVLQIDDLVAVYSISCGKVNSNKRKKAKGKAYWQYETGSICF